MHMHLTCLWDSDNTSQLLGVNVRFYYSNESMHAYGGLIQRHWAFKEK